MQGKHAGKRLVLAAASALHSSMPHMLSRRTESIVPSRHSLELWGSKQGLDK